MKRKINSAQPHNEEEREASQRCMTMWGYVKYPQGPQMKESRPSYLANFFLPKKSSTTVTKLQLKVDRNPKRATYGQYNQPGIMKDAVDIGVASMLTSGGSINLHTQRSAMVVVMWSFQDRHY